MIYIIKYVQNIIREREICKYNLNNGKYTFFTPKKYIKTSGFFTKIGDEAYEFSDKDNILNGNIYGLIQNYIFFANEKIYNLKELNYKFEFNKIDNEKGNFRFILDNQLEIDIIYKILIIINCFEEEETLDFFQWIKNIDKL